MCLIFSQGYQRFLKALFAKIYIQVSDVCVHKVDAYTILPPFYEALREEKRKPFERFLLLRMILIGTLREFCR